MTVEPHSRECAVAVASGAGKPAEPGNLAGEFEDPLVVDVVEHRRYNIGGGAPWQLATFCRGCLAWRFSKLRVARRASCFAIARADRYISPELSLPENLDSMDAWSRSRPGRQAKRADETARPSREEAEAAVRTLIAWAGDDPDPRGPARHAAPGHQGLRASSIAGYGQRPGRRPRAHLRGCRRLRRHRPRPRHPVLFPLRAPHGAVRRQGACRLFPARTASSACRSSPASSTSSPAACRRRSG